MIRRRLRCCSTRQMVRQANTFSRVTHLYSFILVISPIIFFKNTMVLKERTISILENGSGKNYLRSSPQSPIFKHFLKTLVIQDKCSENELALRTRISGVLMFFFLLEILSLSKHICSINWFQDALFKNKAQNYFITITCPLHSTVHLR